VEKNEKHGVTSKTKKLSLHINVDKKEKKILHYRDIFERAKKHTKRTGSFVDWLVNIDEGKIVLTCPIEELFIEDEDL
jgi:hypothetical protein